MHPGISLLEQVIRLAEQEFELLESDDGAALENSIQRRNSLLQNAWKNKEGCDELQFVELLQTIQELQVKLGGRAKKIMEEARKAVDEANGELNSHKKSAMGVMKYCKAGLDRPATSARMFRKYS